MNEKAWRWIITLWRVDVICQKQPKLENCVHSTKFLIHGIQPTVKSTAGLSQSSRIWSQWWIFYQYTSQIQRFLIK